MALRNGLTAYWKLDEASGSRYDTQAGYYLVEATNPVPDDTGVFANCAAFDPATSGTLEWDVGNEPDYGSLYFWSLSFWIKTTQSDGGWIDFGASANYPTIGLASGAVKAIYSLNGLSLTGSAAVDDGAWHHVVITGDGTLAYTGSGSNQLKIYVDGSLDASASIFIGRLSLLTLGENAQSYFSARADGDLDEVAIWSRVVTSTEVTALYNSGSGRAGPAFSYALNFATQPPNGLTAAPLSPSPAVEVLDETSTRDTAATDSITLAIGTNAGGGTLSTNTNPLSATSGLATFTGTSINAAGTGYTLTAACSPFTTVTSSTFDLATPTPISASDSPACAVTESSQFIVVLAVLDAPAWAIANVCTPVIVFQTLSLTDAPKIAFGDNTVSGEVSAIQAGLSRSDSPAVAISDTQNAVVVVLTVITASDSPAVAISEVTAVMAGLSRSDSPAVALTDSGLAFYPLLASDSLAVAITESQSGLLNAFAAADSPAWNIAELSVYGVFISVTDTPTAIFTDSSAILVGLSRSDSPAVAISEVSSHLLFLSRVDTPTIVVTEGTAGVLVVLPGVDGLTLAVKELGPITPLLVSLARADSPAIALSEISQTIVIVGVSDAPSSALADSSAILVPRTASDSPAAAMTDGSAILASLRTPDAIILTLSELSSIAVAIAVIDSPAVNAGDASGLLAKLGVSDSPTSAIGESSAILVQLAASDLSAVMLSAACGLLVMLPVSRDELAVSVATGVLLAGISSTPDGLTGDITARSALSGTIVSAPAFAGDITSRAALLGIVSIQPLN